MLIIFNNGRFKHISRDESYIIYLEYFNNYLTVDKFCNDNNISYYCMNTICNYFRQNTDYKITDKNFHHINGSILSDQEIFLSLVA